MKKLVISLIAILLLSVSIVVANPVCTYNGLPFCPPDAETCIAEGDIHSDDDGWSDLCDAFPEDSSMWMDLDGDGVGYPIDCNDMDPTVTYCDDNSNTDDSNTDNSNTDNSNTDDSNTDDSNTDNSNTDDSNTDDSNTDNSNTDNSDTDDSNTDNSNTDNSDTDDSNTDNSNTDDSNTDDSNTDDSNTDDSNTDDSNTDDSNTDDSNTDNSNTDDSNTDDSNTDNGADNQINESSSTTTTRSSSSRGSSGIIYLDIETPEEKDFENSPPQFEQRDSFLVTGFGEEQDVEFDVNERQPITESEQQPSNLITGAVVGGGFGSWLWLVIALSLVAGLFILFFWRKRNDKDEE